MLLNNLYARKLNMEFLHEIWCINNVLIKDMQTPPLSFDWAFMDDEECAI